MKKRCDRCTGVVGLYEFDSGKWRCPACIWIERCKLLKVCQGVAADLDAFARRLDTFHLSATDEYRRRVLDSSDKLRVAITKATKHA